VVTPLQSLLINSSSENELGGIREGRVRRSREGIKRRAEQERQEGIERVNKAGFFLFPRSSRELHL